MIPVLTYFYKAWIFFLLSCLCYSCSPKVISFGVQPCAHITKEDSVRLTWRVRGKPVLLFYTEDAGDDENPGKQYLTYKMVAQKGSKEATYPPLVLTLHTDTSIDNIIINTRRSGDSAIATGIRDISEWSTHFLLDSLSSPRHRALTVLHAGNTIELSADGRKHAAPPGLTNSGEWEIRTLLSDAEKKDSSLIPPRLLVKTIIIHTKN